MNPCARQLRYAGLEVVDALLADLEDVIAGALSLFAQCQELADRVALMVEVRCTTDERQALDVVLVVGAVAGGRALGFGQEGRWARSSG